MPSKYRTIYDSIRKNQERYCSVPGCHKKRYRIGAFCINCGRQKWLWGHPEAKAVFKRDYLFEKKIVQEIIDKNREHEGIQHGLYFLESYMKKSAGDIRLPGFIHAKRLHEAGADPAGILVELAAMYMLAYNKHTPVKDHNHLKYLLGSKFIRFKRCPAKVKGTEHRDVGEFINMNIGTLLLNIAKSAHKKLKQEGIQNDQE